MSLTARALNYLSGRGRATIWLITLSSLAVLGVVDYLTGSAVVITFFYLLPLALASWTLGKKPGWLVAVLSAAVMQAGPFVAEDGSTLLITVWNLVVRLAVFLVVANLVSEIRLLLTHQTELSRTDSLTGILNHRAFHEAGELEISRMRRSAEPLTLAFLDIDHFKSINDTRGHAAGDELLIAVARCLKAQLWGADIVARLGGDEYGILLVHTDVSAAQKVLPRLVQKLQSDVTEWAQPVTMSIGAVTCTSASPNLDELLRQADQLMYSAKRRGGDCIEYDTYPRLPAAGEALGSGGQAIAE